MPDKEGMLAPSPGGSRPRARRAHFELAPELAAEAGLRLAWVDAVEALVIRITEAAGLGSDAACDFGVAVREAVVNAIRHGARHGPPRVAVSVRLRDGPLLEVTVRDRGAGFDPEALPDPREGENLGKGDGRGVFLMRQLADEVSFAFPRRGGTVTRLRKRLPAGDPREADPGLVEWLGPPEAGRT